MYKDGSSLTPRLPHLTPPPPPSIVILHNYFLDILFQDEFIMGEGSVNGCHGEGIPLHQPKEDPSLPRIGR